MGVHSPSCGVIWILGHGSTTILLAACSLSSHPNGIKSQATILYQRLSLSLVSANARVLLSHARFLNLEEGNCVFKNYVHI